MNGRKALSLALAGIAVVSLAFGTGAFTSVSAERGVSVAVVDDDSAYVGYNSTDVMVTDNEATDLVTVTNRFASDIEIEDVSLGSSDPIAESDLGIDDEPITSGESASISWDDPDCSALTQSSVTMTVEVAGTGVWAKIDGDTTTREFDVTCAPSEAVTFTGNAKVEITTADGTPIEVKYWTTDTSGNGDIVYGDHIQDVPTNESVTTQNTQSTFDTPSNHSVVAITLPEYGVTYAHPNFDVSGNELDNLGTGDGQVLDGEFDIGANSGDGPADDSNEESADDSNEESADK